MITKLEIVADGATPAEKYPFLAESLHSILLDDNYTLVIGYSHANQNLVYDLYDDSNNMVVSNQCLRSYPTNLTTNLERVLYLANGYLVDLPRTKNNIEPSAEYIEALIKEGQAYLGETNNAITDV